MRKLGLATTTVATLAYLMLEFSAPSAALGAGAAENWSRFRGPNGTGVSTAKDLPVESGPEKNVKWKTPLPPGHSSPFFTTTRIFLPSHTPEKENYGLLVIARDRKSGKELWRHEIDRQKKGRLELVNG